MGGILHTANGMLSSCCIFLLELHQVFQGCERFITEYRDVACYFGRCPGPGQKRDLTKNCPEALSAAFPQ